MNDLRSYPILRLTIPLIAGIFFTDTFFPVTGTMVFRVAAWCLFILLLFLIKTQEYKLRWLFGTVLYIFLFLLGGMLVQLKWKQISPNWNGNSQIYKGTVLEIPKKKAKTVSCLLLLNKQKVLMYIRKDSLSISLKMGDELLFYSKIHRPENFDEFDYAQWLLRQGISGTGFVETGKWKVTGQQSLSFKQKSLLLRAKVIDLFRNWRFEEKDFSVLSALTVGYKEELTDELRHDFSVAGISHVLAISGLHVGILWGLLTLLLRPLKRSTGGRIIKWILITSVLWIYAFIAGLAASIVRAVIMCMLVELGHIRSSKFSSLNVLSAAAFFMLIYNPFYLFDVSFQLSFMAVLSIFMFYRPMFNILHSHHSVVRYVWGVCCVSFAAQLGTAPLVMTYFSNFSVYFLLSNLIVAPLIPIIMYLAVGSLLFSPFIFCLRHAIHFLNNVAEWVSCLPYASFVLHVKPSGVIVLYLIIMGTFLFIRYRRRRDFIHWLATLLIGSSYMLFERLVI
ncbi:ComEC/Rec2 family competence protein [Phocaeicola sp.]|uniref:ComEC/Rec2 family competence protein n=1 Tax=Phocaeicola sp. TaxID=2773926 RepID=UPI003F9F17A9